MTKSIFSVLNKYKPHKDISPEENYSTELLVYLLNYSKENKTYLFNNFMIFLGEDISIVNYEDFTITTQRAFITANGNKAFPDITIEDRKRNEIYFIEVKVEANLNQYSMESKDNSKVIINQIQKYESIMTDKKITIYLLTKYPCKFSLNNCSFFKKKIRWHEIHDVLSKSYQIKETTDIEKYLLHETIKYLEDKNMAIPKVSYELTKGMNSLNNLFDQIEIILEGIPHKTSFGAEWLGYYIYLDENKKTDFAWVGTYYDGTKLTFECLDETVKKIIKEKYSEEFELSDDKKNYITHFDFEKKHYFCLEADEQLDLLNKWITDIYNRLVESSKL